MGDSELVRAEGEGNPEPLASQGDEKLPFPPTAAPRDLADLHRSQSGKKGPVNQNVTSGFSVAGPLGVVPFAFRPARIITFHPRASPELGC